MTTEEIKIEIQELQERLNKISNELITKKGESDPIFLLSEEEYEKYKDKIPTIYCWWWLRSPGYYSDYAGLVDYTGSVYCNGDGVNCEENAVRPVLRFSKLEEDVKIADSPIRTCFVAFGVTWQIIDDDLAISEVPIAFRRFDEKRNDYENSEIRKFLLKWYNERKDF